MARDAAIRAVGVKLSSLRDANPTPPAWTERQTNMMYYISTGAYVALPMIGRSVR